MAVRWAGAGARPVDAGRFAGPRLGSQGYNVAHIYALPLSLGAVGVWADGVLAVQVAAIWADQIGFDRLAGYG